MIEHHRDEEVCRRWDCLADEDHTHNLTVQEYFYYKNKWWLHSNKQGSNTMPWRNRSSDFKQALSTVQRLQQESGERTTRAYLLLQAQTMAVGTEFIFYMVELARFLVVFLQFRKFFWRKPSKMALMNSIYFVTDGSFTADDGLL